MRLRLILAAVCMLTLPFWFSTSSGNKLLKSAPFASVAFAGHTIGGEFCQCGTVGCTCDPGELPTSSKPLPDQLEKPPRQGAFPFRLHSRSGFDLGTEALVLALALFVWARLRA